MNTTDKTKKQKDAESSYVEPLEKFDDIDNKPLDKIEPGKVTVSELLETIESENLVDDVEQEFGVESLQRLANRVITDYKEVKDSQSHQDWLKSTEEARKLAKMVSKEKTFPWPGAANIVYPLIAIGAVQHNARMYPSIIKDNQVVRGAVTGADPGGLKAQIAQRIGEHRSYYILNIMKGWEKNIDRSTIEEYIVGGSVKLIHHDPVKRITKSEYFPSEDILAPYDRSSIEECEVISLRDELSRNQIEEKIRSGAFRRVPLFPEDSGTDRQLQDGEGTNDDQSLNPEAPHEIIMQFRYEDFDGDGYKEPYMITVHSRTEKILGIAAAYDEETVYVSGEDKRPVKLIEYIKTNDKNDKVELRYIERTPLINYTQFIPSMDGSWRGTGLGILLAPNNKTINGCINQISDASDRQNAPAGFTAKSTGLGRGKTSEIEVAPNQWVPIDYDGDDIRKAIMPYVHQGPSAVTLSLLQLILDGCEKLQSTPDVATGKIPGPNTPVGTTLAALEQAMQIYNAVFKRKHRSMTEEFQMISRCIRRYSPELSMYKDSNGVFVYLAEGDNDYDSMIDVIPISDPNISTDTKKVFQADALMNTFDRLVSVGGRGEVVLRRYYEALNIANVEELLPNDMAPPKDPKYEIEQEKLALEDMRLRLEASKIFDEREKNKAEEREIDAKIAKLDAEVIKLTAEAESLEAGPQLDEYKKQIEEMKVERDTALAARDMERAQSQERSKQFDEFLQEIMNNANSRQAGNRGNSIYGETQPGGGVGAVERYQQGAEYAQQDGAPETAQ